MGSKCCDNVSTTNLKLKHCESSCPDSGIILENMILDPSTTVTCQRTPCRPSFRCPLWLVWCWLCARMQYRWLRRPRIPGQAAAVSHSIDSAKPNSRRFPRAQTPKSRFLANAEQSQQTPPRTLLRIYCDGGIMASNSPRARGGNPLFT